MAVYFKDLDNTRDWRAVVENLALAGLSAASFDLADAFRSIRDAATGSRPDPSTDERAGVWLRTTVTAALLTLMDDPRFGGPLDRDADRKAAAKALIADALSLRGLDRFDAAHLANPAELPPLRKLRKALPTFLRATTDSLAPADAEIDRRFAELLRSVSARAFALDPDYFAPLVAALTGPFRTGHDRDLAWGAHANWIAGRMAEPIFAPDAAQGIPLAAVYHRLRCW
jgi:hypothetical protein